MRHTPWVLAVGLAVAPCAGGESEVTFVDPPQAAEILVEDGYVDSLQAPEIPVKTRGEVRPSWLAWLFGEDVEAMRSAAREVYRRAPRAFSDEEKTAIRAAVASARELLADYPVLAAPAWSFVKVEGVEGMPHTRGAHIVLPAAFLRTVGKELEPWLLHERIHQVERLDPDLFDGLYAEVYGFTRARVEVCPAVRRRLLTNPDANGTWVFETPAGWIWPALQTGRSINTSAAVAFTLERAGDGFEIADCDRGPTGRPLQKVPGFDVGGVPPPLATHPSEIVATTFSFGALGRSTSPLIESTMGWFDRHLKRPDDEAPRAEPATAP